MMIAQVMQQLFGPVLQGINGDSDRPLGGDQGDEFAGLMAEGDDSPSAAEGAIKTAPDSAAPPMVMPDLVAQTPAVIAVQFTLPNGADVTGSFQTFEIARPAPLPDRAGESPIAAEPAAGPIALKAPPVLAAGAVPDLVARAAVELGDGGAGRTPLGQGTVVIDPSFAGSSSAEGLPDLAQILRKVGASDAPDLSRTTPQVLDGAQTPADGAGKVAPQNAPPITAASDAALERPSGSIPQASAPSLPNAAPNIILQSLRPFAQQSVAAGFGPKAGAAEPPLGEQPIAPTGDGPAPLVTLRTASPPANVVIAALQGIVQNPDLQKKAEGTSAAGSARVGESVVSQTPTAQHAALVTGQGAVPAAAQTPAQMTAALFASVAGDVADLIGAATDEDAPISLFGIEARHGFAPTHGTGLGAGAAGAGSPVFASAPPTAAQLSAQLLPLAQSAQSGPVELVLSPAELGQLRFEIQHRGDQVQIVLSAERPETLDLLRRNSEQLLTDFRNAGFAGASLAFGGWGAGQNAGGSPHEFDREGQNDGGSTAAPIPSSPPSHNAAFARAQSYLDPSRSLNLRL